MRLTPDQVRDAGATALGAGRLAWIACPLSAAALLGLGGCATPDVVKTPASVAAQPTADEATQVLRQWPPSYALYHSGATQAWPTRQYYSPNPDNTDVVNFITDPAMFVVQVVTMPAVLIPDYPFRKIYYDGDVLPYSYSAMPPLPPEPAYSNSIPDPDPLIAPAPPENRAFPVPPNEVPPLIVPPEPAPSVVTRPAMPATPATQPASRSGPSGAR